MSGCTHVYNSLSKWGSECARGLRYIETGAPVESGKAGQVRKISSGRKHRGMASDARPPRNP